MNETKGNIRWAEKFCTDERERALARLSRKKSSTFPPRSEIC